MARTDRWTLADYEAYRARHQRLRVAQQPSAPSPASGETDERENALLARVRRVALDQGFQFYHTHDSRRSDEGYPDCTLVKPGRLLFAELKDRTRKPTHAQEVWLDLLRHSVPGVEAYLWRPQDFGDIHDILGRK
jgi:hypothetical protein